MVFDKVHVLRDVPIKNFGSCARRSVLLGVSVALTKTDVSRLFADGILRHFQGIPHRDAVGEEVPRFGFGHIAQGVVGRAVIKARIVSEYNRRKAKKK